MGALGLDLLPQPPEVKGITNAPVLIHSSTSNIKAQTVVVGRALQFGIESSLIIWKDVMCSRSSEMVVIFSLHNSILMEDHHFI